MSKSNSSMAIPDAIIMTPDEVNDAITSFLESYDFLVVKGEKHSDVDLKAFKNGIELIIESRGNQATCIKEPIKCLMGRSWIFIYLSMLLKL